MHTGICADIPTYSQAGGQHDLDMDIVDDFKMTALVRGSLLGHCAVH